MPLYSYQVMDKTGNTLDGRLEAENEWTAAARLNSMGYVPLEIKEQKDSSAKKSSGIFSKKVSIADLSFFTRQLAAMLTAGIPLTRCLYTLGEQASNPKLAQSVSEVAKKVEGGMSFSDALGEHPKIFNTMYMEMVRTGEIGGSLHEILRRLSEQLEREKSLRDSIKAATFYPSVVLIFAGMVVLSMMFFVVPIFVGFFPEGMELPLATKIIVNFSDSLRSSWYMYILGLITFILGMKTFVASEAGHRFWENIKFRLPIFGELFKKVTIARFSRTLATLLSGGIPVLQALSAVGPASGSSKITEAMKMTGTSIQEGQSIAAPLKKSGLFPPMVINMVSVGEETGQLSQLLGRVADFYEEEVATMTKGLTAIIEPLLLIIVGATIGGIVIAIYLPIFTVITTVGK